MCEIGCTQLKCQLIYSPTCLHRGAKRTSNEPPTGPPAATPATAVRCAVSLFLGRPPRPLVVRIVFSPSTRWLMATPHWPSPAQLNPVQPDSLAGSQPQDPPLFISKVLRNIMGLQTLKTSVMKTHEKDTMALLRKRLECGWVLCAVCNLF